MADRLLALEGVNRDDTSVVSVGTFDGVHVGHQDIIDAVVDGARETRGTGTIVTFDPHPREVIIGELVPLLSTIDERVGLLNALGVTRTIVIPFTRAFAGMSSAEFIEQVIVERVGCRRMVTGHDHGFGRGRSGDLGSLEASGRRLGFEVFSVPARQVDDTLVSSSAIRAALVDRGDVSWASTLLGRRYELAGRVVRGDGRGRSIGFPTANLEVQSTRKVVPRRGVYAVGVQFGGRDPVAGMMNIGIRPTFGGTKLHLEVHILDFDEEIYGETLHVEFVEWLRDERKFGSVDELVEQLSEDRRRCRGAASAVS